MGHHGFTVLLNRLRSACEVVLDPMCGYSVPNQFWVWGLALNTFKGLWNIQRGCHQAVAGVLVDATIALFSSRGNPFKVPCKKNALLSRSALHLAGFWIGPFALPARDNFERTFEADCLLNKNGLHSPFFLVCTSHQDTLWKQPAPYLENYWENWWN